MPCNDRMDGQADYDHNAYYTTRAEQPADRQRDDPMDGQADHDHNAYYTTRTEQPADRPHDYPMDGHAYYDYNQRCAAIVEQTPRSPSIVVETGSEWGYGDQADGQQADVHRNTARTDAELASKRKRIKDYVATQGRRHKSNRKHQENIRKHINDSHLPSKKNGGGSKNQPDGGGSQSQPAYQYLGQGSSSGRAVH